MAGLHFVNVLEDRVGHHDVSQNIAILYQIYLIKCKMVVHDEYFVDSLVHYNISVSTHLVIRGSHDDAIWLMAGRGSQAQLKMAVGVGLAKWATLVATGDVFALVLLIQHLHYLSAR